MRRIRSKARDHNMSNAAAQAAESHKRLTVPRTIPQRLSYPAPRRLHLQKELSSAMSQTTTLQEANGLRPRDEISMA